MTDRADKLQASALRGADAASLLSHPLIREILAAMVEKTTDELLKVSATEHEQRLALCVVLRVLRGLPQALTQIAETGEFDARQLAQLKERADA